MSNFVGKITPIRRPSAIYHIKYHAHSTADNAAAVPDLPSRHSAASRSRLRRCGGVRKREVGGVLCFLFYAFPAFPLSRHASFLCYLYSFARGCAPPHTAKQRPHTGPLLYAIANASPGDAADSVGLAARL